MNIKKKLLCISIIAVLIIISLVTCIRATSTSTSLKASKLNPTVGESVTVTATVVAGGFNVTLSGNGETEKIVGQTDTTDNVSKSVSITFTPTEAKTYTFTLTGDYSDYFTDDEMSVNKSVTITAKAKQTGGNGGGSSNTTPDPDPDPEPEPEPSFSSVNQTVYATTDVNVRSSWSTDSSIIGSLDEGDSVTRTGVGDNGWSRIKYNGSTAYVYSEYLTTTKPEPKEEEKQEEENKNEEEQKQEQNEKSSNKNLSVLEIKQDELKDKLTPKFNKETTQYTLNVPNTIEKIEINAKAEDENAKVEITGNDKLTDGTNIIRIKVTAEDETVRTYIITVEKAAKKEEGLRLVELSINDIEFYEPFSPNVFEYKAKLLNNDITKLNIKAKANDEKAIIEIIGNEDIKEGENLITILVKPEDGKEITTYQIKLDKIVEDNTNIINQFKDYLYVVIAIAILLFILIIALIIRKIRKAREEDFYSDLDDIEVESQENNEQPQNIEQEPKAEETEEINEIESAKKEYLDNFESKEDENIEIKSKKTKRKKGKHF